MTMKTITTHCAYALKAARDAALVPKPPVDIVVKEWVMASKTLMSLNIRSTASSAVKTK